VPLPQLAGSQLAPAGRLRSAGHASDEVVQVSGASQGPWAGRHTIAAETSPQTPSAPPVSAALHAMQSVVESHERSQHTPSAQKPLAQ
jgi:hypothetical protein